MSVSMTFRCPDDLAQLITAEMEATGQGRTTVIVGMLRQSHLAQSLQDEAPTPKDNKSIPDSVEHLLDDCLTTKLDERGLTPESIKQWLEEHTAYLAQGLNVMIGELQAQMEELRGKLKAR